jgi:hypothetical protein
MKKSLLLSSLLAGSGTSVFAAASLAPLLTFGGGDGWLAPGDNASDFVNAGTNTERGLAYNPVTGNLLLASRAGGNNVRILDSATGNDIGGLTMTGGEAITGGTFAINQVRVGTDGAIYGANLASPLAAATPFKIYRWANENAATTPTLAYSSTSITGGRLGDNFDVFGGGTGTVFASGESASAGAGARNGYAIFTTTDGSTYSGNLITFGTPPAAGDFNRGITFLDSADEVLGRGSPGNTRNTTYSGSTGTLVGSPAMAGFMVDYAVVGGVPLLATLDISGATGTNTVRLYDMTDPSAPILDATANLTTSFVSSAGSVGSITFGAITGNTATLYALNVANGIQAFNVTVIPEPSGAALSLLAAAALRRRRR